MIENLDLPLPELLRWERNLNSILDNNYAMSNLKRLNLGDSLEAAVLATTALGRSGCQVVYNEAPRAEFNIVQTVFLDEFPNAIKYSGPKPNLVDVPPLPANGTIAIGVASLMLFLYGVENGIISEYDLVS